MFTTRCIIYALYEAQRKKEMGIEVIFEKIMTENSPNMMNNVNVSFKKPNEP